MQYNVSIYLDKRTKKKNGERPIKLRVYETLTQRTKYFGIGLSTNECDFDAIMDKNVSVRGKKREVRITLDKILLRADQTAKELNPFSISEFEKKFRRKKNDTVKVHCHYKLKIDELKSNDQISTASNYDLSLKSIAKFLKKKSKKEIGNLTFFDINPDFLKRYENYMVDEKDKSYTTVSIYLRCLRTIYNEAIATNDIKRNIYPFGDPKKGFYQVPEPKGRKYALNKEELSLLYHSEPKTSEQEKAKDFWFFSYACNGMNIKDIAHLKVKNLGDDTIRYHRIKTKNTNRKKNREAEVFLTDFTKSVIEKYGNRKGTPNSFVFDIINEKDTPEECRKKVKNFVSSINWHINQIGKNLGFKKKISTYWARHTFATNSIRQGASMEFISEALNHSSLKTTKNYFQGFEDKQKKDFANKMMDL